MPKLSSAEAAPLIEHVPLVTKRQRYPFDTLGEPQKKRGQMIYESFFVPDPEKETTLRSQASRRGKALGRQFSVRRVNEEHAGKKVEGIRIYRIK